MINPTFLLITLLGCLAAVLMGGDQGALAQVEAPERGGEPLLSRYYDPIYRENCAGIAHTSAAGAAGVAGCSSLSSRHPGRPTRASWSSEPTLTSLKTIYPSAAPENGGGSNSVPGVSIWLYNLTAYVDKETLRAHYDFEFVIDPDTNAMLCNASVSAAVSGALDDIRKADCWQNHAWLLQHNYTVPAHFSFAWRRTNNYTQGTAVLVLRSTNPASARHCPNFPHDACWAQGLYWVDPAALVWYDGVQVYAGDSVVRVDGTYCRSGMPECAWSEYIY